MIAVQSLTFGKMKTFIAILMMVVISLSRADEGQQILLRDYRITDVRLEQALERIQEYKNKEKEVAGKILVIGQVTSPGFYKIEELTLSKAVSAAGGLSRLGSPSHFYILRSGQLTEYYAPHGKGIPVTFEIKSGDAVFMEYQCTSFGATALLESIVKK